MEHYAELHEYRKFTGPAEMQKAINSFRGILEGISIDGVIDSAEQQELKAWYDIHRHLVDRHPFSEILPAIDTALEDNILTADEARDLLWLCDQVSSNGYYDLMTSSIQTLHGVLHGVIANNILTDVEICKLIAWLDDHSTLQGIYPFDEVYSLVSSVVEDGVITEDERNTLRAFFSEFVDAKDSFNLNELELKQLQEQYSVTGICAKNPRVEILGHTFCFTGTSNRATRDEIASAIYQCGGKFTNSVSKKVDYLVVGSDGNPCWAFSCYGRKVEKAVTLRKEGYALVIVNENDFWNTYDSVSVEN